jgi:hypothetical protein
MRATLRSALVLGLLAAVGPVCWPAGPETARGLLDQAIQAHGGADQLVRARQLIRSAQGEITYAGSTVPFRGEVHLHFPDQARFTFDLGPEGQKLSMVFVINRDKGWQAGSGATRDLTKQELEEFREEAYAIGVTTLLPLRNKSFELTLLPETRIGDNPAVGLKVSSKGHADVKLYFDKRTHLLVKAERRAREGGLDVDKETFFSEPKDFDGPKLPARIVEFSGGKKTADVRITAYRFPARVDENAFSKP